MPHQDMSLIDISIGFAHMLQVKNFENKVLFLYIIQGVSKWLGINFRVNSLRKM
jgi:hypothetical protein